MCRNHYQHLATSRDRTWKCVLRDPSTFQLTGIRALHPHALHEMCEKFAFQGALVAADVYLGSWRPHHIASEIFAQLNLRDPTVELADDNESFEGIVPTSAVAKQIDRETVGDRAALDAYKLAVEALQAVADRDNLTFLIITGACRWESCDLFFVRFLAQMLSHTKHRLVLAHFGPGHPWLPKDWSTNWVDVFPNALAPACAEAAPLVALVPGIVPPEVAEALAPSRDARGMLIPLMGGCYVVPPVLRSGCVAVAPERYDQLAAASRGIPWLAAYSACLGSDTVAAPPTLWTYARRLFECGSFGTVLRLLGRAIPVARSPMERALFQLLMQSALIADGRFADAGALVPPDQDIAAELRGWLWHTKGWGLTMTGRHVEAEKCLDHARNLLNNKRDSDDYLYVLNISALNELKLGNWETALAFEQQISDSLKRIKTGSFQIMYINSLNLARLYMRRGRYDTSERYYNHAFATSIGVHSESDAIYSNVCQAKVYEARGQRIQARNAWARAALYWMSSRVPEAVAPRVVAAILNSGPMTSKQPTTTNLFDKVSAVLTARLLANGTVGPNEAAEFAEAMGALAATFITPEALLEGGNWSGTWHVTRGAGACFIGVPRAIGLTSCSATSRRLRSILLSLLGTPQSAGETWTILVDDRLGNGLAEDESELVASCLRFPIDALAFGTRQLMLDGTSREALERQLRVRVAKAVARVEPYGHEAVVIFKRYRPPQKLTGADCRVMSLLQTGESWAIDMDRSPKQSGVNLSLPILRKLEQDHIVELFLHKAISFPRVTNEASQ